MIKVVIADDHPLLRRGVRQLLESEPDCEILAEGEDLDSARRYVRGHQPDVLVIDLNMPGASVLDALPDLSREFPRTAIVVLTMQEDLSYVRKALGGGALGYVLKDAADQELVAAVRAAASGQSYLNPRLGAQLAAQPAGGQLPGGLSPREIQVLELLALGLTNAQVGERLYISVRTVDSHRAHIQQKLGVGDRQGLVDFARRHGLDGPEPK